MNDAGGRESRRGRADRDPDDLVAVATFLNRVDADLAQGALKAQGIESIVSADDAGGVRPHLWMGGVRLLVRREDAERANEVLGAGK